MKTKTIYFAGGCFWGTEHYFKQVRGVVATQVGYANGRVPESVSLQPRTGITTNRAQTADLVASATTDQAEPVDATDPTQHAVAMDITTNQAQPAVVALGTLTDEAQPIAPETDLATFTDLKQPIVAGSSPATFTDEAQPIAPETAAWAPTYEEVYTDTTGFAETVQLKYDPEQVSLRLLGELFFRSIDPTSLNRQGNDVGTRYRTGVYYTNPEDRELFESLFREVEQTVGASLAVELEPLQNFYPAEEYHQDYLDKHPEGYCHLPWALMQMAKEANAE